ncbi:acyl-CoA reductase [uncultured Croceitalea sp.]|uniref:acyl-CoA reductase n=1 Tax=uncultured Croceitalea sp. TaxID=1798908 RepID=UPI003306538E
MAVRPSILQAFINLGNFLRDFCDSTTTKNQESHEELQKTIQRAGQHNGWFTEENVCFALQQWGEVLTAENLEGWLANYDITDHTEPKTIAIIMAGNIPLVGFHDFICVLVSGHRVLAKLSSNDNLLLPFMANYLIGQDPSLKNSIAFTEDKLTDFDAVIATGSNNTGRYFEYYFGKHPNIIRKNRNSVAVLTGEESVGELKALGQDIFQYFGLGCRSVSKLFVPKGYDFATFFEAIYEYQSVINTNKYANNYDYNKAVFLMSDFKILDNNFLLLKEDEQYASPIGTLYFEHYANSESIGQKLHADKEQLQCVVGKPGLLETTDFGTTQTPRLNDYADGVDTISFLLSLDKD